MLAQVRQVDPLSYEGRVTQVVGTLLEAELPGTAVGTICEVQPSGGRDPVLAEVVGFRGSRNLLMPFDALVGITHGSRVRPVRSEFRIGVGPELLGRVLGPLGEPLDGKGPVGFTHRVSVHREAPPALTRSRIREPMTLGVRAMDSMLTLGKGQRIGIMAGTGVGKSTLLGMLARNVQADISVIALIGERGREVREFIEENLGEEGMARSVVVAVTGDASPVLRVKGAFVATTIAEYFRDMGNDVLFMMDSVTRLAMAQREIGLAAGEPPTARGYTPSVFSMLPRVLERCGPSRDGGGSVTAVYTVLVEGDDENDPIGDAVRGIVDGQVGRGLGEDGTKIGRWHRPHRRTVRHLVADLGRRQVPPSAAAAFCLEMVLLLPLHHPLALDQEHPHEQVRAGDLHANLRRLHRLVPRQRTGDLTKPAQIPSDVVRKSARSGCRPSPSVPRSVLACPPSARAR